MSNLFKNLFGKPVDLKSVYASGAMVLDVRSPEEFRNGHMKGALNVPLDTLEQNMDMLKKNGRAVITCCRSGARSSAAASLLSRAGIEAYNGGGWPSLERSIR